MLGLNCIFSHFYKNSQSSVAVIGRSLSSYNTEQKATPIDWFKSVQRFKF